MAQRRMFSKSITNSGKFLKMPASSRLLYYDLGMNADDDGYAEWFTVMRMSGSSEQDLQVLRANGLVEVFDENVLVILDWRENNQIRLDRYQPSKYKDIYVGLPNGNQMATIGKPSIGKDSIGKVRIENTIAYLSNIPEEDTKEFLERFDISKSKLKSKAEDLMLYCQSKGKVYKNYKAFLLNALKKDCPIKQPKLAEPIREANIVIPDDIRNAIKTIL